MMNGRERFNLPQLYALPKKVKSSTIPAKFKRGDFSKEFVRIFEGPTEESNWLIPNWILMSSYPFAKKVGPGIKKLERILSVGVKTFIKLQTKKELRRFTSYEEHARTSSNCKFVHFPIPDCGTPRSMRKTKELVEFIISEVRNNRKVLIHCFGGHGRTGTISCCVMAMLYKNMKISEVFQRVESAHDVRRVMRGQSSPQVPTQFLFVVKFVEFISSKEEFSERMDIQL